MKLATAAVVLPALALAAPTHVQEKRTALLLNLLGGLLGGKSVGVADNTGVPYYQQGGSQSAAPLDICPGWSTTWDSWQQGDCQTCYQNKRDDGLVERELEERTGLLAGLLGAKLKLLCGLTGTLGGNDYQNLNLGNQWTSNTINVQDKQYRYLDNRGGVQYWQCLDDNNVYNFQPCLGQGQTQEVQNGCCSACNTCKRGLTNLD